MAHEVDFLNIQDINLMYTVKGYLTLPCQVIDSLVMIVCMNIFVHILEKGWLTETRLKNLSSGLANISTASIW